MGVGGVHQSRVGRGSVEVDPADARLLGERVGQGIRRQEAADDEDGAEKRVLALLQAERGIDLLARQNTRAHQHVAEVGARRRSGSAGRRGFESLERKNLSHTNYPRLERELDTAGLTTR